MKLAQALQERADLNRRIAQLRSRLIANATVQEGEESAEDPYSLLAELDGCIARLQALIAQINLTNASTIIEGRSLTAWIAEKDTLNLKIQSYRDLLDAASRLAQRAARSEIRIKSTVQVPALQKQLDELSRRLRIVDDTIQQSNWTIEL